MAPEQLSTSLCFPHCFEKSDARTVTAAIGICLFVWWMGGFCVEILESLE